MHDNHELIYFTIIAASVAIPPLILQNNRDISNNFIATLCGILSGSIIVLWGLIELDFSVDWMLFSPIFFVAAAIFSYVLAMLSSWIFRRIL